MGASDCGLYTWFEPDEVPGEFGFEVGLDGESDQPPVQWVVRLPHQCGLWEVEKDPDRAVVVASLERFIAEAQAALEALRAAPDLLDRPVT